MNIALRIAYDGTGFHGWQRQAITPTVQQTLEQTLAGICGAEPYVSGCGRTDAGVHAKIYVCNFKADCPVPLERLPRVLNGLLPDGISVEKAVSVPEDFDARFSCKSKEYTYVFSWAPTPDPFRAKREFRIYARPDVELMDRCGAMIAGTRDFACFQNTGTEIKDTVRTVFYCRAEEIGRRTIVRVRADGFLYNMVRNIAGTLLYVGIGKIGADELEDMMTRSDRTLMGPTLPPQGLYMTGLDYDMEALDGQKNALEI